jgi:hypothetical protein
MSWWGDEQLLRQRRADLLHEAEQQQLAAQSRHQRYDEVGQRAGSAIALLRTAWRLVTICGAEGRG